jgi:uncharacterized membrane protein YdjX (TVP38/TMEM64 family)
MRWTLLSLLIVALILIPFFLFEEEFNRIAQRLAAGEGATWSVALGTIALLGTDVFLPIPSSIVSTFAGALLGFWGGASVVWLGMTASCLLGYWVGLRSARAATRFVGADGVARASALAERYGSLALVICRPIPVLAEASVIVAGLVRSRLPRFLAVTAVANLGIAMAYGAVGAYAMQVEQSFLLAFLGAVALPGMLTLAARLWLGRSTRPASAARDRPADSH